MKKPTYIIAGITIVLFSVVVYLLLDRRHQSIYKELHSAVQLTKDGTFRQDITGNPSPVPTVRADKWAVMKQMWEGENGKSMDTYGKVIDQYGEPVVKVKVTARVGLYIDFTHSGGNDYYTETDAQGRFHFIGIHGAGAGFTLLKEGYEYNQRLASASRSENYSPDPENPIIFKMWKLKEAEPMVFTRIHDYIPCDGSDIRYNFTTGRRTRDGGDMTVTLTRNPVNINRGKPYDWGVTLRIENGGLMEQTDPYPYEAPADGYQLAISINMPANMPNWVSHFNKSFYFKCRDGKNYGRMTIEIYSDFQPPPTAFSAAIYMNSSGSRNLEFHPPKEVAR